MPLMIGEMSLAIFFAFILSLLLLASNASLVSKFDTNNTSTPSTPCNPIESSRGKKLETTNVLITGNSTISSPKRTFNLGFVSPGGKSSWYLAISYASIPTPPIVWVANREKPITNLTSTRLEITAEGKLAIIALPSSTVWQSTNTEKARRLLLEETGNLVLLSAKGLIVWQSFDFPTDTWLPDMNITSETSLISWRSINDPSPGLFSLRINPQGFNEFELVYNKSAKYWSTGNWTGNAFSGVPEMTIPYIYKFHFSDPFMPSASFWYTERELDGGLRPPLTRFQVDVDGQLKQYTWTQQNEYWNMFWSQPENQCRVYGLCGNLGVCNSTSLKPCVCVSGFSPDNDHDWESGDYTGGCVRESRGLCEKSDGLVEVGAVEFEGATIVPFVGARSVCERTCLSNCSCIGLFHDGCRKEGIVRKGVSKSVILIGSIGGSVVLLGLVAGMLLIFRKRRKNGKGMQGDGVFPGLNLKVFTYKELFTATRGFSDKLGHGGFGAVFQGELLDSTLVAVKRLERPGSGEKEFRAEVCTIGNIQHINLVRLRGFCSENSHRLLIYDYMPNGPLSAYLRRDGLNLSWDVRFRVAVSTARGIAYLHEECRDCIIHCDIKPENILLDSDYTAKVVTSVEVLATMRGTWGYVAPEWISGVAITTKADVYSYGMTLLELLGGRRNVEAPPSARGAGDREGNVAAVVDDRLGSAYDIDEAQRVASVAIWCIQDNEEMRPTMGLVVKMLEGVVEVTTPPPPKLLQALVSGESYHGVQIDSDKGVSIGGDNAGPCTVPEIGRGLVGEIHNVLSNTVLRLRQYVDRHLDQGRQIEAWTGLSWLAYKDIWAFFRLSTASAVILCLQIWYFMPIIVLTGHLEDPIIAMGSLSMR
uniref:Receptor-like serine/threonine-protein kinase n=1 Tax=Salix viminalis TaxID=40686 RepID=A0A6N2MCF3_SALVM